MRFILIYIYIALLSFLPSCFTKAQEAGERIHIYGNITDASTKEALPYASIRIKNSSKGCSSDVNGYFSFHADILHDTLLISSIGYKEETLILSPNTNIPINIALTPTEYALKEVTIKPKKEKYSKKGNPAVLLARTLIEKRNDNAPKNKPYYSRDRHEKLSLALNNLKRKGDKHFGKRFGFLEEYIDTSVITGEPILYISSREIIASDYHQDSPERNKQHIKARKRNGIDDMFSANEIDALYEEIFKDVDIFQDDISIFRNKFVSPLSKLGPTFYRYYIMDTVDIRGEKCINLSFAPFNAESFGFTGQLYITADSTFFIKSVQMNVPKDINMNFVDYMNIRQDFSRTQDGTRVLDNETLICELKVVNAINGFYAHREVTYKNHSFEISEEGKRILANSADIIEEENSMNMSEEFWATNRLTEVREKERSVGKMMEKLRANPLYYWTEKCVSFLFTGWIPLREKNPPLFYGPVNTSFSYNGLEGLRLRTGMMSSAYLNPHLFGRYYLAYGVNDKKLKYMGELEYSFKKKKEHPNEFPIHSLRMSYVHDIYQYGQNYLYTNKDNFVLSLKSGDDNKIGYIRKAEFTYTHELQSHFSYYATIRHKTDISSRLIQFERTSTTDGITTSTFVKDLKQSEIEVGLRYAPKEKFMQKKWDRISVTPEKPVFTLSHKIGFKGILGSEFYYHHTEMSFRKRFWFSAFGYTDCIIKAGKIWNQVPYPLLIIPNTNLSYTIQKESYYLMNAMEFFNDQYASWDLTYHMNGLLFNRIPLVKKLKWREVISFRGMFGHLSKKNRPDPLNTGVLYKFPYENDEYHYLGTMPYMEAAIGIENIFKVLRVDYVRRLTYTNLPNINKWGIRIQFHVEF
ncbi:MAG: carboxypeptidase-like regulatory domain-containing protein [Bacteroidaceae bacterium]|nr:carboxypeptidase-like regulatory domain-containing protein [Bacteroidaceae bacterium]